MPKARARCAVETPMSWFKPSSTPPDAPNRLVDLQSGEADPVRDALVTILEALRAEAKTHNRPNYDRVLTRLSEPTPPADLLSDIHEVLARRSAGPSAFTGAGDAREYGDMARNLTNALRQASIPDPGLQRSIIQFEATLPRNIGPEEARRVASDAANINSLAQHVRQRTIEDRIEIRELIRELSATITRAQGEASMIVEDLTDPLEIELDAAVSIVDRLGSMLRRQGVEIVDLHSRSARDPLTKVCHRGTFAAAIADAVQRAQGTRKPLSLLVGDLDNLATVNANWGPEFGDVLLVDVARLIQAQIRDLDIVARVGGGTFAIILPGAPTHVAVGVADRIRHAVESASYPSPLGPPARITISIGAAHLHHHETADKLFKRADRALQEAKQSGRNAAVLAV